jgi:hypothetical protein
MFIAVPATAVCSTAGPENRTWRARIITIYYPTRCPCVARADFRDTFLTDDNRRCLRAFSRTNHYDRATTLTESRATGRFAREIPKNTRLVFTHPILPLSSGKHVTPRIERVYVHLYRLRWWSAKCPRTTVK